MKGERLIRALMPRTLLIRTFLLLSILLIACIATWAALFAFAEREPRAQQLGQLTASVVNLTRAAIIAANPDKRLALLRDLAETEGVHLYPVEATDIVTPLPNTPFFLEVIENTRDQLGPKTRLASAVNGQQGVWASFSLDGSDDDEYWLMLPGEHAESDLPLYWLGWGCVSLASALLVAWLIVSRISSPLRRMATAANELGQGRHPAPIPERGALELRQLAATFNRMSEDLKRMDHERAEVLAGISHDLRTPLTRLRLELELSISDENARQAIAEDIEQMDAILGQFLDYARGNNEPPETIDVNSLVAQAVESLDRTETTPLTVRLTPLPQIQAQPKAISRALINLLGNACKYGGGATAIEVETHADHEFILIDVLDRGPGIPQHEVQRLKQPFTRLNSARSNNEGTGLGLAIVDRIVRLHGGQLELLPRPGGGLVARLQLPRPPDREEAP